MKLTISNDEEMIALLQDIVQVLSEIRTDVDTLVQDAEYHTEQLETLQADSGVECEDCDGN